VTQLKIKFSLNVLLERPTENLNRKGFP